MGTSIEIDGNWFNKKSRAVIEWKGQSITRKMADFKWLSKMLLLNSTEYRVCPEHPDEIPSALWRRGYLRKRKNELNLYVMQCHSLPWIRRYKPYCDIFLESDKNMTYRPEEDVVANDMIWTDEDAQNEFIEVAMAQE